MQECTAAAIAALLRTDKSVTASELARITGADKTAPAERIVRLKDVGRRLGVSRRTVSSLLVTGALVPVHLPGRVRAIGVRESALQALIEGHKPGKAA